jgi:hypothetical protein
MGTGYSVHCSIGIPKGVFIGNIINTGTGDNICRIIDINRGDNIHYIIGMVKVNYFTMFIRRNKGAYVACILCMDRAVYNVNVLGIG